MANLVLIALGAGIVAYGLFSMYKSLGQGSSLERHAGAKQNISEVSEGGFLRARLRVEGNQFLTAPYSNSQCVYYSANDEVLRGQERSSPGYHHGGTHWEKVGGNSESVPFFLTDGTSRVLVDMKKLNLNPNAKISFNKKNVENIPYPLGGQYEKRTRKVENTISSGDELSVFVKVEKTPLGLAVVSDPGNLMSSAQLADVEARIARKSGEGKKTGIASIGLGAIFIIFGLITN